MDSRLARLALERSALERSALEHLDPTSWVLVSLTLMGLARARSKPGRQTGGWWARGGSKLGRSAEGNWTQECLALENP